VQPKTVKRLARECGFELAGIAAAGAPAPDYDRYEAWVNGGMAGEMGYLTDCRADVRRDVHNLLPSARSVICVGKLYNPGASIDTPGVPGDATGGEPVISRYASGRDYHQVLREGLERLVATLLAIESFEWKICVDTAPLLERSLARQAGLGWIGKNTCLINEPLGSWFFLGELITSLAIEPDSPPPDRCGTCTRCIEACPTRAFVPNDEAGVARWSLDARSCISYLTIELRGPILEKHRAAIGPHVFGCDICQEVCPWNARAPVTRHSDFLPGRAVPSAQQLAYFSEEEFRSQFEDSPIARPKHCGFLRNLAVAMGNSGQERFREPLEYLARHPDAMVAEHARWALSNMGCVHG